MTPYLWYLAFKCRLKYKNELFVNISHECVSYYNSRKERHCPDGPAVIHFSGDLEYHCNGKLHNPHGPAVVIGNRLNYTYTIKHLVNGNYNSNRIPNYKDRVFHITYDKVSLKEFYVLDDVLIGEDLGLYGQNSVLNYQLMG